MHCCSTNPAGEFHLLYLPSDFEDFGFFGSSSFSRKIHDVIIIGSKSLPHKVVIQKIHFNLLEGNHVGRGLPEINREFLFTLFWELHEENLATRKEDPLICRCNSYMENEPSFFSINNQISWPQAKRSPAKNLLLPLQQGQLNAVS